MFYKEGKEALLCETYKYIMEHFSPDELAGMPSNYKPDHSEDEWIMENLCKKCEFLVDGCGYREGEGTPPCGGYAVAEWLRKKRR